MVRVTNEPNSERSPEKANEQLGTSGKIISTKIGLVGQYTPLKPKRPRRKNHHQA
jgi:hypothetical protein